MWLHVVSDGLIATAYFTIPITLVFFVQRRKDLQFHWMFLCFALFILACGASHVMEIWTIWYPTYWLAGAIKALTALASIFTAFMLTKLVPIALALPSPAALAASNERLRLEIVDRIRIERMLSQKNLELRELNEELNAFSYSVSHDLRAPLRSVDGFSLALLEDYEAVFDADAKDALRRIRLASQRMGDLIDALLRLSQVGRAPLRCERLDLSALCGDISAQLVEEHPQRSLEWVIEPGMYIEGDKPLMRIALRNLLENAWKFTSRSANAVIRIGSAEQPEGTVYFVADNGAGFDMRHVDKIFGAFQRLHSDADFPGTGIGLALVNRIILRHGGRLSAESKAAIGTTLYFYTNQKDDHVQSD